MSLPSTATADANHPPRKRGLIRTLLIGLPLLVLGILTLAMFVLQPRDPYDVHGGLVPTLAGTGERPFVNRALLPVTARLISGGKLDPSVRTAPAELPSDPLKRLVIQFWGVDAKHAKAVLNALYLMALCYSLFGLGTYWILRTYQGAKASQAMLVAVLAMLIQAFWMWHQPNHIYDASTVAFAAFLTALGLRRRTAPFVALMAVALFAKESLLVLSLLLLVPLAVEKKWKEAGLLLAVFVAEYLLSRAVLQHAFGDNPGRTVQFRRIADAGEFYWQQNLKALAFMDSRSFEMWLKLAMVLTPLIVVLRKAEPSLRRLVLWPSIALLVPMLFVGRFVETRVFLDLFPLWIAVASPAILRWYERLDLA